MKAVFKTAYPYMEDAMNLPVENLEAAIPFYETIMGFQLVSRKDTPCKSKYGNAISGEVCLSKS